MAKRDDIPKTDPSEIKALIQRLKQSNLEPRDTQLAERLLRFVLSFANTRSSLVSTTWERGCNVVELSYMRPGRGIFGIE
jgi:hypothetical protein